VGGAPARGHAHAPRRCHPPRQAHGPPHDPRSGQPDRLLGWLLPHSHDIADQIDPALERSTEGIRATKLALVFLLVSSLIQLVIAIVSGSVALFADMVHNVADGATSIPLWIAFVLGRRASTRRYGYGYRRSEDLAGLFIVLMIAGSAVLASAKSIEQNARNLPSY
jgi:Co/Zn/Cd efflux system component